MNLFPTRLRPLLVAAVGLLALPASAMAAETVGGDLGQTADGYLSCDADPAPPCVFVQTAIGGAPATPSGAGVVTRWHVRGTGSLGLRVFRPASLPAPLDQIDAAGIGGTQAVDTAAGGDWNLVNGIAVRPGDLVGVALPDGDAGIAVRQAPAGEGTGHVEAPDGGDATSTDFEPFELFSAVDVEPDADGDGLGDESQDGCVGTCGGQQPGGGAGQQGGGTGQQGGGSGPAGGGSGAGAKTPAKPDPYAAIRKRGPAVSVARKARATRRGVVAIAVTNPYGFDVRGMLSMRPARGSKRFKLGGNVTGTVSVKLPKATMRKLRRAKGISLEAVVTARGPVGKARVTKRKLAVSAPKPKRKHKRRKPSGQGGGGQDGGGQDGGGQDGPGGSPGGGAPGAITLPDGQYKGNSSVSFKVEGGRIKSFFGFVPIFCAKMFGNGFSHFDTAGQAFVAADAPAIVMPSRTFSGMAANSYRRYTYEGRFMGDGSTVTGTLKASYTKTTLDPFPQNAWDTTTYACSGTQGFTASRVG
jgi:hypothetical protein